MKTRAIILALFLPASALAVNPAWLHGWTAAQPTTSGYTYPTNGLCWLFRFDSDTTTNNLAEATNNCSIVAGRGTTVVLGEGLVTTNLTGNVAAWSQTAIASQHYATDRMTVNAWVKWLTLADRDTLLYGSSTIMRQTGSSGDLIFYLYGVPYSITASNICLTSEWQMLTFVYNGTNQLIFKNGAQVATSNASVNISANTSPKLGSDGGSDTAQFILREIGQWSVAWSPTEITNHFAGTKGTRP